jgi:glucuronoarabinoxylan endo-1,4-beta-xylanase
MHHMNLTFRRNSGVESNRIQMTKWLILVCVLIGPVCRAQTATVDWTNVHQVVDGFGANVTNDSGSAGVTTLTQAQANFFFGTGNGQVGMSLIRLGPPLGSSVGVAYAVGDCSTVNSGCSSLYAPDVAKAVALGASVYVSPFSVPAAYTTNGSIACSPGNGQLATAHYADFATWLVNFVKSLQQFQGAQVVAITAQNEPEFCASGYPNTTYNATEIANFIGNNLGPAFAANGLSSVLILGPETGTHGNMNGLGYDCTSGFNATCNSYLGGYVFHDYDAQVTISTDTVSAAPLPSNWTSPGGRYWMDEVSCQSGGGGPSFCTASFDPSMKNALGVAAMIDRRLAIDNVNEWSWWWFLLPQSVNNGEALLANDTNVVPLRTYVIGQYSRFIRPGYFRIDATHAPQAGVSVSAYQNTSGGNLAIVATNYTGSPITQTFNLVHAPTFSTVTPHTTSATQSIQAQASQSVSSNSFTYTLPANSVTTFVGTSSGSTGPVPPTKLQAVVN